MLLVALLLLKSLGTVTAAILEVSGVYTLNVLQHVVAVCKLLWTLGALVLLRCIMDLSVLTQVACCGVLSLADVTLEGPNLQG